MTTAQPYDGRRDELLALELFDSWRSFPARGGSPSCVCDLMNTHAGDDDGLSGTVLQLGRPSPRTPLHRLDRPATSTRAWQRTFKVQGHR